MVWRGSAWDKNRGITSQNEDRAGWGGFCPGDKVYVEAYFSTGTITTLDPDQQHVNVKFRRQTVRVHNSFVELRDAVEVWRKNG